MSYLIFPLAWLYLESITVQLPQPPDPHASLHPVYPTNNAKEFGF